MEKVTKLDSHVLSMILQSNMYLSPKMAWGFSIESKLSNAS